MSSSRLIQTKLSFTRSDSSSSTSSLKRKHSDLNKDTAKSSKMAGSFDSKGDIPPVGTGSDESDKEQDDITSRPEQDESTTKARKSSRRSSSSSSNRSSYGSHEDLNEDYVIVKDDGLGHPFEALPQSPDCFKKELPPLKSSSDHVVFFQTDNMSRIRKGQVLPQPLSGEFRDSWHNDDKVKMPCSKSSRIIDPKSPYQEISRWELIEKELNGSNIDSSFKLEEAILQYNSHYRNRWNFDALHEFLNEHYDEDQREGFFSDTLPRMIKLAMTLPKLIVKSIPFLKQRKDLSLTFSQQQVACLLANAFFCTFPRRNFKTRGTDYPDINFSPLFAGPSDTQKMSKIKCIIKYFQRVTEKMPKGVITYTRRVLKDKINWENSKMKMSNLHMSAEGTIEDKGKNFLQMDFANRYVGGGVLGHGCVQEEIRFLICPEMIISRLFTEVLLDEEVLVMTGCERFSSYDGYSKSFKWTNDYHDDVERDEWGRLHTEVVAMDAVHYRKHMNQYEKHHVTRELNKAYCAFLEPFRENPTAVCTGNWGCGAFGGDPEVKALIQLIAASQAKRDVCYLSLGNTKLCKDIVKIHEAFRENAISVGEVYKGIIEYSKTHRGGHYGFSVSLVQYWAKALSVKLD